MKAVNFIAGHNLCDCAWMETPSSERATRALERLCVALRKPTLPSGYSRVGMAASARFFNSHRFQVPVSQSRDGKGAKSLQHIMTNCDMLKRLHRRAASIGRPLTPAGLRVVVSGRYGRACQFPPYVAGKLLTSVNAKHVLDPFAGWGDRLLAAAASPGVLSYHGIDCNKSMTASYAAMESFLKASKLTDIKCTMTFGPAETMDYSMMTYDTVLTCPPYWRKELYSMMPRHDTEAEFMHSVMHTTMDKVYRHLKTGGHMLVIMPWDMGVFLFEELGLRYDTQPMPQAGAKCVFTGKSHRASREVIFHVSK